MPFSKFKPVLCIVLALLSLGIPAFAQHQISGNVIDKEDSEPIIGAQGFSKVALL